MFVASSLNGVNKLLTFGYCKKVPVALFGPPKEGKSIFCLQEALYLATQLNRNVLYIDTEGAGPVFLKIWEEILRKRFSTPDTIKVFYEDLRRIEDILGYHGFKVELKLSKTGKIETVFKGSSENLMEKKVAENNIGVIVYDSMSNPIKISFPGGRMNYPARADAIDMWLNAIHFSSMDHDLVPLVVHHRSIDPTNPYAEPYVTGGETVLYNFKVILYLAQRKFKPHSSVRDIFLVRWYNKKEWEESVPVILTDRGYFDISEEELARMARGRGQGASPA